VYRSEETSSMKNDGRKPHHTPALTVQITRKSNAYLGEDMNKAWVTKSYLWLSPAEKIKPAGVATNRSSRPGRTEGSSAMMKWFVNVTRDHQRVQNAHAADD